MVSYTKVCGPIGLTGTRTIIYKKKKKIKLITSSWSHIKLKLSYGCVLAHADVKSFVAEETGEHGENFWPWIGVYKPISS